MLVNFADHDPVNVLDLMPHFFGEFAVFFCDAGQVGECYRLVGVVLLQCDMQADGRFDKRLHGVIAEPLDDEPDAEAGGGEAGDREADIFDERKPGGWFHCALGITGWLG